MLSQVAVRHMRKNMFRSGVSVRLHKGKPDTTNEISGPGYSYYEIRRDAFKIFHYIGKEIVFYNYIEWRVPKGEDPDHIGIWCLKCPDKLIATPDLKRQKITVVPGTKWDKWTTVLSIQTGVPKISANLEQKMPK